MTSKNLTRFLTPDLSLKVGSKTYVVKPPSRESGKIMVAINVAGVAAFASVTEACPSCGRSGPLEMDESMRALVEANSQRDLGELSLGDTYQEMLADGIDGPTLEKLEMYAFYYWTLGEAAADQIFEETVAAPKARKRSKSGRSTE